MLNKGWTDKNAEKRRDQGSGDAWISNVEQNE